MTHIFLFAHYINDMPSTRKTSSSSKNASSSKRSASSKKSMPTSKSSALSKKTPPSKTESLKQRPTTFNDIPTNAYSKIAKSLNQKNSVAFSAASKSIHSRVAENVSNKIVGKQIAKTILPLIDDLQKYFLTHKQRETVDVGITIYKGEKKKDSFGITVRYYEKGERDYSMEIEYGTRRQNGSVDREDIPIFINNLFSRGLADGGAEKVTKVDVTARLNYNSPMNYHHVYAIFKRENNVWGPPNYEDFLSHPTRPPVEVKNIVCNIGNAIISLL